MRLSGPGRDLFDIACRAMHRREVRRRHGSTLHLRGLRGPVEVVTDVWGVPHIYADTREDLFFAQGYVTARDRLFQLEYNRHAVRGRLCELVGRRPLPWRELTFHLRERTTFDVDVLLRAFGLERAARASAATLSEPARAVLDAYVAGVNAYIERAPAPPTLEHRILGIAPRPWDAIDSLSMLKGIAFEMTYAWRAALYGALLDEAGVPEDVARVLRPHVAGGAPTITGTGAGRGPRLGAVAAEIAATALAADRALGIQSRPGTGSNCFAVAATHSATGGALLANDTHMALGAPVPWHEVRLLGGGLDLKGFAVAGVPGIGIGRNAHGAWGITAGLVQDLDLFVEELHPEDARRYRTPNGWAELDEWQETIVVRGEGEVKRTMSASRHGPLLETVSTLPGPARRLAIAWSAHAPSSELDTLLELWGAKDRDAVRHALRHHGCPTYNVTYAGADGRVAYFLAGHIPGRRRGTPLRPLEGWTGEWDWGAPVPYGENPVALDPEEGFVITANNRVGGWDYPYELGDLFEPTYRFERIRDRLRALRRDVTAEDLAALQLDTYAPWAVAIRDTLLPIAGGVQALAPERQSIARAAAELWRDWDGHATAGSPGAAVAYTVAYDFAAVLVGRLGGEDLALAFVDLGDVIGPPVLELCRIPERLAELGVDLSAVARNAFTSAVERCRAQLGDDPGAWRWGALHPLFARHRLHGTPLGWFFSIGPEPSPGGPDTVNRGDVQANADLSLRIGPAMRWVADVADPSRDASVLPGGQSGARTSPHFDDQARLFVAGRLKRAPSRREDVEPESVEGMVPARGR